MRNATSGIQGVLLLRSRYAEKPGRRIPALDILPQSDIDGIVILRDIPFDVIQTTVADLNINLTAKYQEEIPERWNLTQGLK